MPYNGALFLLIGLVSWLVPIVIAIWLILSINEIKSLLRDMRTELRRIGS